MKKTVFACLLTLIVGLAAGFFAGSGRVPLPAVSAGAISTPAVQVTAFRATPAPDPALDESDNAILLRRSGQVLDAMKARDFNALSRLVHPEEGVTFTPYSTVNLECNNNLSAKQIADLESGKDRYIWGLSDGKGEAINMTGAEYFTRYVWNADYTQAPQIGIDTVLSIGNAMENVADSYPGARFVEYHFPGLDPKMEGFDWCSLKLVFRVYQNNWYLIGLVHSEWTI